MREPRFWWCVEAGVRALALSPLAGVYGAVAARRMTAPGAQAGVPVICIGNPTLGGAGKTPTALAVASLLEGEGRRPVFLSRGYGGALSGPVLVDSSRHATADVGDEPLLLSRFAPTIVARDRVAGAGMAVRSGAGVIVMDDGFQNPSLRKDRSLLVVDGRGVGNGLVFPAGPLRAPLAVQLDRADALLVIGDAARSRSLADAVRARGKPVFHGRIEPDALAIETLRQRPVLAFAGIGDPEKFFETLRAAGVEIARTRAFPDHHRFTVAEAAHLLELAVRDGLAIATTEKDHVRLTGDDVLEQLAAYALALPVRLVVTEADAFRDWVLEAVAPVSP